MVRAEQWLAVLVVPPILYYVFRLGKGIRLSLWPATDRGRALLRTVVWPRLAWAATAAMGLGVVWYVRNVLMCGGGLGFSYLVGQLVGWLWSAVRVNRAWGVMMSAQQPGEQGIAAGAGGQGGRCLLDPVVVPLPAWADLLVLAACTLAGIYVGAAIVVLRGAR